MAELINLKVTPETLQERANALTSSIYELESDFNALNNIMDGTGPYWIGEAGDRFRRDYEEKKKSISQLEKQLETYPTKILRMAGLYEDVEDINTQRTAELDADLELEK